jgi:integrase
VVASGGPADTRKPLLGNTAARKRLRLCYALCYFYAMLRSAHHPAADQFTAVYDSRKQRVRGLWRRGARYYAQMRVDVGNGISQPKRIPLQAATLDQARAELEEKRTENRKGQLHAPGRRPSFAALAAEYMAGAEFANKALASQRRERLSLARWVAEFGNVRCDWVKPGHLAAWRDRRKAQGVKPQVVNLDVIAFGNAMRYAVDRGWVAEVPRLKRLKPAPPAARRLLAPAEIQRLLAHCQPGAFKNADLLRYYVHFLSLSGARRGEALRVRWADVDFARRQVTIGAAPGDTKGGHARRVNMSQELEALLAEMHANKQPDSQFLFPGPCRGASDRPASALEGAFNIVRRAAGLPGVGFHDLRHFFASQCVMQGVDFMTIAHWLGHRDGGILVGRVYGHLSDSHQRRMANNLVILKAA